MKDVEKAVTDAAVASGKNIIHTFICNRPADAGQNPIYDVAVAALNHQYRNQPRIGFDFEAKAEYGYLNEEIERAIATAARART